MLSYAEQLETSLNTSDYIHWLMQDFNLPLNRSLSSLTEPSPFQEYADQEGFLLVNVERSYQILSVIDCRIPNYYELCEKKAKAQPELAADLYAYLRQGINLTPEQFLETHNNLADILC